MLMFAGLGWPSIIITNYSFEDPSLSPLGVSANCQPDGTGCFLYRPSDANVGWTFSGSAGVASAGPTNVNFGVDPASGLDGTQVAFIQKADSVISQTISGLTAGQSYYFTFLGAARPRYPDPNYYGGGEDFMAAVDTGTGFNSIGYYVPPTTTFSLYDTYSFIAPSNGIVTLRFLGLDLYGLTHPQYLDETSFIDNVQIVQGDTPPDPPAMPEPASVMMALPGLGLLALAIRAKRK